MNKQWACSSCGFACSSSSCNACRSKNKLSEDDPFGKIEMIFGNLTALLLPAAADPHFYCGKPSTIQINQEYEGEETVVEAEKKAIWDSKKVKKKKRSKLHQHTVSPLARFINHLQSASSRRRRLSAGPKYDDVLIYQKCSLYVEDNEIGLGAELLPPLVHDSARTTSLVIKEEPCSTNDNVSVHSNT